VPRRRSAPGFGERLRTLRLRLGYSTAADFARKMGLSYPTYRQWEVFNSAPSTATLMTAVRALEIPDWERLVFWLAAGEGSPPPWLTAEGALERGLRPGSVAPSGASDNGSAAGKSAVTFANGASLPWRSIEALAQQARSAQAKGDEQDLTAIARELLNLLRPHLVDRGSADDSGDSRSTS
jgi:transcriptional regulator with XRE-family HTH domain